MLVGIPMHYIYIVCMQYIYFAGIYSYCEYHCLVIKCSLRLLLHITAYFWHRSGNVTKGFIVLRGYIIILVNKQFYELWKGI